jgi:DNA (cytosine-5)-methyltransferase 1
MTLRLLDTFSGIGGFSYAAERIVGGFETVAFVEREPYCQQILHKHWPSVPIYDDITTFNPEPYSADVVCGGFPCQDISTAGKQAGIKQGTRSGLFYELMRVIRLVRPQYVILENVSAIISNGLDTVLGELATAGLDAEWACIPASAVGACHQRDRWWLVAYPNSGNGQSGPLARSAVHEQAACQGANGDAGSTDEVSTDVAYPTVPEPRNGDCENDGPELLREMLECRRSDFAPNTMHNRLQRRELPSPTISGQHKGRKVGMGSGEAPGPQQWPNETTGRNRLNPDWRGFVSQPVLCRGDDGLSNRVERLKALGNAVVPQVAAIPLARVRQLAGV